MTIVMNNRPAIVLSTISKMASRKISELEPLHIPCDELGTFSMRIVKDINIIREMEDRSKWICMCL